MAETRNIYEKLALIRKQVEVIQKNKSGYGYKYVSEDEILSKISVGMDRHNLSLIPSILHNSSSVEPYSTKKTKTTKQGEIYEENVNEILVHADMTFTWVNNDNPEEKVEVPWVMVGHQGDGSQSFGSGLTYAMRYFLLKFFNIATVNDDPDAFRTKQKEAAKAEDNTIAKAIIEEFDGVARAFLVANPDKKDEVKQLCATFVKSGDYKKITESVMAAKLLSSFKETFEIKE